MELIRMELLPRIREKREEKGLKQKFVAKECKISQQMLSEYENGKTFPRANILFRIANILDSAADDLYERVDKNESVD
jgi:putative transcriptional regulator